MESKKDAQELIDGAKNKVDEILRYFRDLRSVMVPMAQNELAKYEYIMVKLYEDTRSKCLFDWRNALDRLDSLAAWFESMKLNQFWARAKSARGDVFIAIQRKEEGDAQDT